MTMCIPSGNYDCYVAKVARTWRPSSGSRLRRRSRNLLWSCSTRLSALIYVNKNRRPLRRRGCAASSAHREHGSRLRRILCGQGSRGTRQARAAGDARAYARLICQEWRGHRRRFPGCIPEEPVTHPVGALRLTSSPWSLRGRAKIVPAMSMCSPVSVQESCDRDITCFAWRAAKSSWTFRAPVEQLTLSVS